jgi:biotin transport system substrate-specific component
VQQVATYPTLSDAIFPKNAIFPQNALVRQALLIVGAVVFLALCAQISWNIPISHAKDGSIVPVTGQTFAVLVIGALLGSRLGGVAIFAYIAAGVFGAPVFADWSRWYSTIAGSSGGYILGFFPAAIIVGFFAERGWDRSRWIVLPMLLGNAIIYVPGLIWLNGWFHVMSFPSSWHFTFDAGLWPFIAGDSAKLIAATLVVPAGWSLAEWRRGASS